MSILQHRFALIRRYVLGVSLVVPLVFAQGASAAVVTFSNQASFLTAAPGAILEDFESSSLGATSFADFSVTSHSVVNTQILGLGPTSGTQFLNNPNAGIGTITFTFTSLTPVFGINMVDALDTGVVGSLSFSTNTGANGTIANTPLPNANVLFFGITDFMTPFTSISFTDTLGTDGVAFDDAYTQVSAVPLPAALPLFLSALAGLGLMGWRRRSIEPRGHREKWEG